MTTTLNGIFGFYIFAHQHEYLSISFIVFLDHDSVVGFYESLVFTTFFIIPSSNIIVLFFDVNPFGMDTISFERLFLVFGETGGLLVTIGDFSGIF